MAPIAGGHLFLRLVTFPHPLNCLWRNVASSFSPVNRKRRTGPGRRYSGLLVVVLLVVVPPLAGSVSVLLFVSELPVAPSL